MNHEKCRIWVKVIPLSLVWSKQRQGPESPTLNLVTASSTFSVRSLDSGLETLALLIPIYRCHTASEVIKARAADAFNLNSRTGPY